VRMVLGFYMAMLASFLNSQYLYCAALSQLLCVLYTTCYSRSSAIVFMEGRQQSIKLTAIAAAAIARQRLKLVVSPGI
jgi:hypothetical protein